MSTCVQIWVRPKSTQVHASRLKSMQVDASGWPNETQLVERKSKTCVDLRVRRGLAREINPCYTESQKAWKWINYLSLVTTVFVVGFLFTGLTKFQSRTQSLLKRTQGSGYEIEPPPLLPLCCQNSARALFNLVALATKVQGVWGRDSLTCYLKACCDVTEVLSHMEQSPRMLPWQHLLLTYILSPFRQTRRIVLSSRADQNITKHGTFVHKSKLPVPVTRNVGWHHRTHGGNFLMTLVTLKA